MGRFFRWFLVLLLPLAAVSQQKPTPPQNTAPPQLQTRPAAPSLPPPGGTDRQITLDVQVTDKSGGAVRGLQKQDFTLLDDKQTKNILSFRAVDGSTVSTMDPVEVVLVVDAVNATFQTVNYERNEIRKFLLQNGGKLSQPVSLIVFTDAGTKIQEGSSRDGNVLAALYDQYETGLRSINRSQGFYGAADRFDLSLKTLTSVIDYEDKRPGRKLMIWLSPGWPLLEGPNVQLSTKDEQRLFNAIVAASTGLRQARITLYSVDPLGLTDAASIRVSFYEEFLKGVAIPRQVQPGDLGLQVLVVQSGGRVLNSSNDLTTELAHCAADADAFYVLSFEAARADQANEYHSITVKMDKPGIAARTRTGYYAQP
ncbi:MAG: VWA domain-containing protein [Terriglobales bacterium]